MDHPAALHRLKVGVPATVEHSSEAGPETGKWVAETTQVRHVLSSRFPG
jgi:ESCRT-I complex subunit VPS28